MTRSSLSNMDLESKSQSQKKPRARSARANLKTCISLEIKTITNHCYTHMYLFFTKALENITFIKHEINNQYRNVFFRNGSVS